MPSITGTISGSIKSISYNVPSRCTWLSLYNKTAGSVTVNLGVVVSGRDIYFLNKVISANSSYDEKVDISMYAGTSILIVASGQVDYVFTINGGDN
jgi:hypothetical protein